MISDPNSYGVKYFPRVLFRRQTGITGGKHLQHPQDPRHVTDAVAPKRVRPCVDGGIAGARECAGDFAGFDVGSRDGEGVGEVLLDGFDDLKGVMRKVDGEEADASKCL